MAVNLHNTDSILHAAGIIPYEALRAPTGEGYDKSFFVYAKIRNPIPDRVNIWSIVFWEHANLRCG